MFKDVPANAWYAQAVYAAVNDGLLVGSRDDKGELIFRPNDPVTRAEMAAIITRIMAKAWMSVHRNLQKVIDQVRPSVVMVYSSAGLGSGTIIDSRGYVMTNEHVVKMNDQILPEVMVKVLVREDEYGWEETVDYKATVVATRSYDDLALLRIQSSKSFPAVQVDANLPNEGTPVVVIGHPYGLQYNCTYGIVTQDVTLLGLADRITTDAAVNPGNSGGGMFGMDGRLLGVPSMKIAEADNMGFVVQGKYVMDMIKEYLMS